MDNLSRCMILCKKEGFGVRYGAWRATKGSIPVEEKKIPEGFKKCEYCGELFKPSYRSDQKYCDSYCQKKASEKRCKKKKREGANSGRQRKAG